ncbi:lycopene cyclase domain-containing protein [uncultured Arsenicicoccus sp.]|uniref:lycopene cyclase domain-containing protein n=1 Tax=uncultured Arsenicicoccus sp. TaxID=491339 RepID=UPI002591D8D4|nr:lycopene cyclase domain-containing protein [uncultured Arsenicicoccus sp.]
MTFTLVNAVMLGAAALGAWLALPGVPAGRRGPWLRPMLLMLAGLAALTVVFDNLMIAADLFDYGDQHRSGVQLGLAPIEDLAYPLGAAILLPALWVRLRDKGTRR